MAAAAVGVLVGFALEALPEPTPEMYLILADYTVGASNDECFGAGAVSGVVEGSVLLVFDTSGAQVGSVVLPIGKEIVEGVDPDFLLFPSGEGTGCLFDFGNR